MWLHCSIARVHDGVTTFVADIPPSRSIQGLPGEVYLHRMGLAMVVSDGQAQPASSTNQPQLALVSRPFNASTPWSKSSSLFCALDTMGVRPSERKLGIPRPVMVWRAFVTVTSNRTTPISNFTRAARLSFSVLIHVLGTAPIKAPFDHVYPRSAFWHWNYFWRAPTLQ